MYQEETSRNASRQYQRGASLFMPWQIGVALLLLIAGVTGLINWNAHVTANQKENALNREYKTCWVMLGQYYTDAENALGIAQSNTNALDKIVKDVALGNNARYTNLPLNNPNNQVYLDIQRAYPDLHSVSDVYKEAGAVMFGDFQNYSAETQKLQSMIEDFENYRTGFDAVFLSGYPDYLLAADNGSEIVHGQQAEDQMSKIITNARVAASYQSGHTQSIPFPSNP
jgi:hypothetical protein